MKAHWKRILLVLVILVFVKLFLASLISAPSAPSDDYFYAKMAQSFFDHGTFSVDGVPTHQYPPLYPIMISLSYLANDMRIAFFLMKFINVILSSLIIIPAFFLAREFFDDSKSLLIAVIVSVLPATFSFSGFILAENLFYTLFLTAFYFVYKSFKEDSIKFDILAGIFIGLAFLTRVIALSLVVAVVVLFLCNLIGRKVGWCGFLNKVIMGVAFLITISPWLVRNGLLYGFTLGGFFGLYASVERGSFHFTFTTLMLFIYWFVLYLIYLLVASLALLPVLSLSIFSDKKLRTYSLLFIFTAVSVVFAAVNHNLYLPELYSLFYSKVMGRYVDVLIPVIVINGFIGLSLLKKSKAFKYLLWFSLPFFLFSFVLLFYQLFPPNNMMLSWLGFLRYAFEFVIYHKSGFDSVFNLPTFMVFTLFFLCVFFIILLLSYKKLLTFRNVGLFCLVFLLGSSLVGYGMVYYNAEKYWYNNPQTQLGLWFNDYDRGRRSTVLFDSRDEGMIQKIGAKGVYEDLGNGRSATIMGFWVRGDVIIGDPSNPRNADYVVSKHNLDYQLLKSFGDVYLYRVCYNESCS